MVEKQEQMQPARVYVPERQKESMGIGEEPRVSDIRPKNWELLFPTHGKAAEGGKPGPNKLLVAGGLHALDLDLQRMQVIVRIRPSTGRGADTGSCIHAYSQSCLAMAPPEGSKLYRSGDRDEDDGFTSFTFSRVFGPDAGQQEFYRATAAPMVRGLMDSGLSSVMMAYGVSGAGKTYTMEGVPGDWGVIFLSIQAVFEEASREDHLEKPTVKISHYEIYREKVHDLLANVLPTGPGPKPLGPQPVLNVRDDAKGRVIVDGLTEVEVSNTAEAYRILRHSCRQERKRAPTGANDWSSRSHSIITVALYMPELDLPGSAPANAQAASSCGSVLSPWGRLSFVDLAGNERADRTGNTGQRMEESKAINKSLFNLQACLRELRWNQQNAAEKEPRNVPYRASKLTHLLRDVLHGWGQLLMCVNVSPTVKDFEATVDTLRYATLARRIGTAARAQPPARVIRAKTPNITKKRQARQSVRPEVEPPAKRLRSSTVVDAPLLASPEEALGPEAGPGGPSLMMNAAVEAILEEEDDERVMDLEAEIEELREQLGEAERERLRLEEHQMVIADVVRGEVCEEWRSVIGQMADEHEAKRTQEIRALKESHQREVEALEQQLQEAAAKPRKKGRAGRKGRNRSPGRTGRAGSPGSSAPAPPSEALQHENAALKEQMQELQLAADKLRAELSEFQEQAQREAAKAAQQTAELAAALQAQVAATQSAEEALSSTQASHRADILRIHDRMQAAVRVQQAATRARDGLTQEILAVRDEMTEAGLQIAELEATIALEGELSKGLLQDAQELRDAQAEAAETIQALQLRLGREAAARARSEKAADEAKEALASFRVATQAREAELQAEVDASRAAWEAERPRQQEEQVRLEEMKVQLEADASMRVHMLERELARAQKDILALQCQLRCQPGSAANPAVLRAAAAEGAKDGPKGRGAAGTPHNIALARAIADAQLSPLQSTPVQQSVPTPEQATGAAGPSQPTAVHASAAADLPVPDHGASPLTNSDAAAQRPASVAQLQASQPDAPAALGAAAPEQALAETALTQRAPHMRGRRMSKAPSKSAAAQPGPAQEPGPEAQKPAMARTRRQTMAAAGHAPGTLARNSQAEPTRMARADSRLASPAEHGPGMSVGASQQTAPRARQTRRASAAPQNAADAGTARQKVQHLAPPLRADSLRHRGASTATAPNQAGEAAPEPQPPLKRARRKTAFPHMTATPDQEGGQASCACAMPALCSLATIKEDMEVDDGHDEEPGPSCVDVDSSACKQSTAASAEEAGAPPLGSHAACEAPAQDGCGAAGQKVDGGKQFHTAVLLTGEPDRQVSESHSQQLLASREEHSRRGDGEQDQGPVRRSARRAVLAARVGSADGQPACAHPALSPVMEHAAVPAAGDLEQPSQESVEGQAYGKARAPDPARRRTRRKENTVSNARPASACSQKPTEPAQKPPAKRTRKRKLLSGRRADDATAEALYGTQDPDALPLQKLAMPMAMRKRRSQRP